MTSSPHSAPTPGLPDLERELDRFRSIRQLRNHWARPAGRRSYYWYLTFEPSAELRSLTRTCQEAIAFPYYDNYPSPAQQWEYETWEMNKSAWPAWIEFQAL